eukprot:TRINITY_DN5090_c0_g1_i1.p1 TRINITY_DN5090_c0_g1~~TRINITY_DN5090_c0_g1_i1.p1  ORF type:complete len:357 (+),score=62.51 TRINITY_DN5090_c0_g1_i1:313-1383(+)
MIQCHSLIFQNVMSSSSSSPNSFDSEFPAFSDQYTTTSDYFTIFDLLNDNNCGYHDFNSETLPFEMDTMFENETKSLSSTKIQSSRTNELEIFGAPQLPSQNVKEMRHDLSHPFSHSPTIVSSEAPPPHPLNSPQPLTPIKMTTKSPRLKSSADTPGKDQKKRKRFEIPPKTLPTPTEIQEMIEQDEPTNHLMRDNWELINAIRFNLLTGNINRNHELITRFHLNLITVLYCLTKTEKIEMPPLPIKLHGKSLAELISHYSSRKDSSLDFQNLVGNNNLNMNTNLNNRTHQSSPISIPTARPGPYQVNTNHHDPYHQCYECERLNNSVPVLHKSSVQAHACSRQGLPPTYYRGHSL